MSKTLLIVEKNPSGACGLKKAHERGLNVVFMGSSRFSNRLTAEEAKYVDSVIDLDVNDMELALEAATQLHAASPIDGVITFMEFHVPVTAMIAQRLGLPGISPENAMNARDKVLMRRALARSNVPVPAYKAVRTLDEAMAFAAVVGFPNIIKPSYLAGSRGVFKNNTPSELEAHFCIARETTTPFGVTNGNTLLLEEFMDGPEFSIESISHNGTVDIVALTMKRVAGHNTFVETGHVLPAELDSAASEAICRVARDAVTALGVHSAASHTEIKFTSEGPKIVEVGARLAGDHIPELVELATGVDMWNAAISVALGEEPELTPTKKNYASISYLISHEGIIERIDAPDLCARPGIVEAHINARAGDTVNPLRNSSDRLGYVIARGDTAREAEIIALEALNSVSISVNSNATKRLSAEAL